MYLFESELSENESIVLALTKIYGINKFSSIKICKKLGFSNNLKVKNLSKEQVLKLLNVIKLENFTITSDLKKLKIEANKKLINIKSYRGLRKKQGLPVRGQRTHTNAKTSRKRHNL